MSVHPYVFPALDEITRMQAVSGYQPLITISYDILDVKMFLLNKYPVVFNKCRDFELTYQKQAITYTIDKHRKHFTDRTKRNTKTGIVSAGMILGIDHSTFLHRVRAIKTKMELSDKYEVDNDEVLLFQQKFELEFLNEFKK